MGATLEKLVNELEGRSTWRNAALAFGVIVLSNLAMAGYLLPNIQTRHPEALESGFLGKFLCLGLAGLALVALLLRSAVKLIAPKA